MPKIIYDAVVALVTEADASRKRERMKMEEDKKKMVKIDIAFEIAHQMLINLVLVLFSTSETRYIFIR